MNARATIGTLAALGLVLAAGFAFLNEDDDGARGAIGAAPTDEPEGTRGDAALESAAQDNRRGPVASAPAEERETEEAVLLEDLMTEPAPPRVLGEPDLDARSPLALRVVDRAGVGVAEAEVRIHGLRSTTDPGSLYRYRGDEPVGRTDTDGRVTLEHWDWVNVDGRTRAVDVRVLHAEFAPFRDSAFRIDEGEREIVLTRGSTVVVSAWIGTPSARVAPITVQVDRRARLADDAWTENQDGSLQTSRLEPGEHLLRVRYESEEHGVCFSAIEPFTLAENDWHALHLELVPAEPFVGELDPAVPRPVRDAHVQICVRGGERGGASLSRRFEAVVAADGTFTVEGLPRGDAQLIALATGWVSQRVRPTTLAEAGISSGTEPTSEQTRALLERVDPDRFIPQVVRIPQDAAPYVVPMEPAAIVELRAVTTDGAPLEGVGASLSPNVCYLDGACSGFPWRDWRAETDADGRARIVDVPPGRHFASAGGSGWRPILVDDSRWARPTARSGETTTLEIVLERDE